jgi:integrase/recombinase XerD
MLRRLFAGFVPVRVSCAMTATRDIKPRLHDLRATFAVHRLVSWHRSGVDLQRLLPQLSTYRGHINIQGTQRYLTLTPEPLREASDRFERYAMGPSHE